MLEVPALAPSCTDERRDSTLANIFPRSPTIPDGTDLRSLIVTWLPTKVLRPDLACLSRIGRLTKGSTKEIKCYGAKFRDLVVADHGKNVEVGGFIKVGSGFSQPCVLMHPSDTCLGWHHYKCNQSLNFQTPSQYNEWENQEPGKSNSGHRLIGTTNQTLGKNRTVRRRCGYKEDTAHEFSLSGVGRGTLAAVLRYPLALPTTPTEFPKQIVHFPALWYIFESDFKRFPQSLDRFLL
ncbi:hypothetical protein J3A83DRAFT_4189861 [Scleroderma citrinum]